MDEINNRREQRLDMSHYKFMACRFFRVNSSDSAMSFLAWMLALRFSSRVLVTIVYTFFFCAQTGKVHQNILDDESTQTSDHFQQYCAAADVKISNVRQVLLTFSNSVDNL